MTKEVIILGLGALGSNLAQNLILADEDLMELDHLSEQKLKELLRYYARAVRNLDPKSEKLSAKHWWGKLEAVKQALQRRKKSE